ncbi:major facilitator superfamily MFS_1 [Haladaptatus paucihalophilus DX253]|uniref:Major facilitator superfamily MFS_1 n=1 Tax=Haladaptatus paucihalophilus DX253 TaxID=797209 RepID=E7QRH8_HALPU|nr:MFS transporter [Haladaptatus paucihalophilus]EFW92597.1 major facilitator superfamily MFS_1 [Haladaptatus paucihalophilus DX253]SHK18074.1 Predicted arabinose efflux permease, MFS family [Haladaptatus paucihalophilus DX253]
MSGETSGGSLRLFRNREFIALAGTAFARSQAYSTILIALALYADMFHTTSTVEGLFGTAFAVVQLLIVLPLGRYIDIRDSKRILLIGLFLNVLVFVGFSFVETVEHVILMRVLQGTAASILWLTGTTVVGEISDDGSRGLWIGTYNQVGAFSSLFGDIFGGLLLYLYGFETTYAALSLITIGAFLAVFFFLRDNPGGRTDPEDASSRETFETLLGRSAIKALVFFRLSFSVGKMAVITFLPIYAYTQFDINPFVVGGIMAGGKLTKSLTQGKVGDWTDRVGEKYKFILAGALVYALGTALIPFAGLAEDYIPGMTVSAFGAEMALPGAFFVLFAAYAVLGVGDSLRLPASMALFVEEGEQFEAVGSSLSLRSIAWKVGQVGGPVFIGAIWDATSVFVAFWAASGFIIVSSAVFAVLYSTEPAPGEHVDAVGGD